MLNITKAIKTMSTNDVKYFIFENFYKQIGFFRKISYNSMKQFNKKDLLLVANKSIKKYT